MGLNLQGRASGANRGPRGQWSCVQHGDLTVPHALGCMPQPTRPDSGRQTTQLQLSPVPWPITFRCIACGSDYGTTRVSLNGAVTCSAARSSRGHGLSRREDAIHRPASRVSNTRSRMSASAALSPPRASPGARACRSRYPGTPMLLADPEAMAYHDEPVLRDGVLQGR